MLPPQLLAVEQVPLEQLHPDPANPRRIGDEERDVLERSLRQFGFVQPILARRADGVVIGGHQRLVAARRLGLTSVPVIWLDLSVEQARLLGLALNKISGAWDDALLARLLSDLGAVPELDLSLSGFDDDEVKSLLRTLEVREQRERPESFDLEAALDAARQTSRTKPGELWVLGEHRLLCGDATKAADVERLLGGRRADLGLTDPPYGVAYQGGHGTAARRWRPIANDALDPVAFEGFVRAWAINLLAAVDGALYLFMSSQALPLLCRVLGEVGGHWSDTLIWSKGTFTLGRAPYQRAYEPIWFGWRDGAPHFWCGARDQSDVWTIPRPASSPLHPTQKPLALLERAIEQSSRPGERVLDLFAGSGSTMIAAQRTGRVALALELDPRYCDVALARWEAFSGQKAVRSDE
ncbi:MAG: site-specific DNA-methyltransferase [Candidatus Limnocylindrales bacterium]